MHRTISLLIIVAAAALTACPEDNPDYCTSDTDCAGRDPAKPECHGEGGFCYEGCTSSADCADTTKSWYRAGHPYCDPTTHDCLASPLPDGGTDGLPDADSEVLDFGPNKLENGIACVAGAQCKSGQCVDDVCCADSCTGSCMACNLDGTKGTCNAVPASAGPQQDCAGDPKCGNGVCNGAGGCSYPNAGQPCGSVCVSGKLVVSLCDTTYQCVAQAPTSCNPYTCMTASGTCRTSCTQHVECDPASACDRSAAHTAGTGTCVPLAQADTVASGQEIATVVGATTKPVVIVPPGTYNTEISLQGKTIKIIGKGTTGSPVLLKPSATNVPAIFVKDGGKLTVQGLTIQGATGTGGDGLRCAGPTTKATLVAVENTIKGNESNGVEASYCDVTLRRNVIQSNQAGGAKLADGAFVVVNNVVAQNGNSATSSLGGLKIDSTTVTAYNNTIANNSAITTVSAGAICSSGGQLVNSIVYSNGTTPTLGCTFTYSDVEGSVTGTGNINQPPQFINVAASNYAIATGSQCINAGTATTTITAIDITGGPRLKGSKVDMGAYEVQ